MPIALGAPLDDVPVGGRLDGEPWIQSLDFYEVSGMVRCLITACFVTIAYLTGMRVEELRGLERGCARRIEASRTSPERFEVWARTFKDVTDATGNTIPEGMVRAHPWWAVKEVHTAIAVLERIHDAPLLLNSAAFARRESVGSELEAARPVTLRRAVAGFIAWCNGAADRLGQPWNRIPPDPEYPRIPARRFRQTIARDIAKAEESPQGALTALNRQFDHRTIGTTLAYMSKPAVPSLLEVQRALARHNRYVERGRELDAGMGVSGPASERVIRDIRRHGRVYGGAQLNERELDQLRNDPELTLFENPQAPVLCGFRLQGCALRATRGRGGAETRVGAMRPAGV